MNPRLLALVSLTVALAGCQDYALAELPGNYIGKLFYSVDLNNYDGDAHNAPADAALYTLTIANPEGAREHATVDIRQLGGEMLSIRETIQPGTIETFDMPRWDAEDSFVSDRAFSVESSTPVLVHQFNPAMNVGVYSNDASLLLPQVALGKRYRAACWPQGRIPALLGAADYVTVVATADQTTVSITPTSPIREGLAVPSTPTGTPLIHILDLGEVLQIEGDDSIDGSSDLTGSLVEADKPVVVFSGNECAEIPGDYDYCDHIEEQLIPVDAWGTRHFAVKFATRGAEQDVIRVIADQDGTEVSSTPAVDGLPATLAAGEFVEFMLDDIVEISTSAPVGVVQYMTGSTYGDAGTGDPAMVTVVPEGQFLDQHVFLTPGGYQADYVNVVAPRGSAVTIDGESVASAGWSAVPSDDYLYARIPLEPGAHQLESSLPVGAVVYGYDDEVSYAYPGGAALGAEAEDEE